MDWTLLVIQMLNGLQLGVLLFMLAAGLTLVFGIMDFINLAHGSLYMVGAYFCATIADYTDSFLLGALAALPLTFAVGLAVEIVVVRKLYARDHLDHVLATFGCILFFDAAIQLLWGPEGIAIALPAVLDGRVTLGPGIEFPTYRLLIIIVGLAVAAGLAYVVSATRIGALIRAGASNRRMLGALGIDVNRLFTFVFAGGATLAGLAGLMMAPITEAYVGMGNDILIVALVVIIIGGIGSVRGAFIAALLVGMIDTMGRAFLDSAMKLVLSQQNAETAAPALSAMLIYILMAAILAVRPQGLFAPKGR
ncbi:MAG: branched-chain amino acid ABC transporter permease [Proteobacteria bacterium]|nr:branched-chain amino acid ABC transporter permease [Pseudomonadota bacterium]